MTLHSALAGADLHGPYHYEQGTDPGAVGAGRYWHDTATGLVYQRDITNTTWALVGNAGTVTSVGLAAPTNFAVSGSPVTGAASLTFTWSVTAGRLLVGAGTSAMTELAPGAGGNYVRSDGSTWTASALQASDCVLSLTGTSGGALTGALTLAGGSNATPTIAGSGTTLTIDIPVTAAPQLTKIGLGISPVAPIHSEDAGSNLFQLLLSSAGTGKGLRAGQSTDGGHLEGVDNTGNASYQPLFLGGSALNFQVAGTSYGTLSSGNRWVLGGTSDDGVHTAQVAGSLAVSGVVSLQAGTSGAFAKGGGALFDDYADVSTSTTTETDLFTHSVPGNTLANDGDSLDGYMWAIEGSGTGNNTLNLYFAGTNITNAADTASGSGDVMSVEYRIIRDSSTSVRWFAKFYASTIGILREFQGSLTGLTLTGANILKITGQCTGTAQLTAKGGKVKWFSSSSAA